MRALIIILIISCITFIDVLGQIPTFNRNYPGISNFGETMVRPVELDSGNYYFASAGYSLFPVQGGIQRIANIDDMGDIISDNLVQDSTRRYYGSSSLIKSSDNNLVLLGTRSRLGATGGSQIFVLKIKPNLTDTLWTYYHRDSSFFDVPVEIVEHSNGDLGLVASRGFLGVGEARAGAFLILNSLGELKAETIIETNTSVGPENVITDDNGGYIVSSSTGPSFNNGAFHPHLVFLDSNGVIQNDYSNNSLEQAGLSRYDENSLILSGYSWPYVGPRMVKFMETSSIIWSKTYSSIYTRQPYIARKVSDGGIVAVGISTRTENDGYIMKSDSLGNLLWAKEYDLAQGVDFFADFIETKDGGLLVGGAAIRINSGQDAWLLKLDANGCLDPQDCEVGVRDMPLPDAVTIYPNPAQEWLKIDIEQNGKPYTAQILDATGRLIQNQQFSGIGTHTLNLSGLAKGIYYCRVMQGNELIVVEKVIKF